MNAGGPATGLPWARIGKLLLLVAALIAANFAVNLVTGYLDFQLRPANEDRVHMWLMIAAVVYTLLLAIPFVPGAEIGLSLMAMLGAPIVFLVYVCTLAGLTLSFAIGRMLPLSILIRLCRDFRLERLAGVLEQIEPMDKAQRLAFLTGRSSNRHLGAVLRYRYVALALALNIPGNVLIGGGGGIALVAGLSGVYSFAGFFIAIAIGVAPVPLLVLVLGNGFLAG